MPRQVPTFSLYGETTDEVAEFWVHAESIPSRSRLHNWEIKPHRHDALFQILHIRCGSGEALLDGIWTRLHPRSVVTVPSRADHGFRFSPDVDGSVITFMARRLPVRSAGGPDFRRWLSSPRHIELDGDDPDGVYLAETLSRIEREVSAGPAGTPDLVEAYLASTLILLYRLGGGRQQGSIATRDQARFDRLVSLISDNFRSHRPVEFYAERLGLSSAHLNRIARLVSGKPTSHLIAERIVGEAKRDLVFSNLTVQLVASGLGFDDQAYFTRFFTRQTGMSPRQYRAREMARLTA
ncbi:helix-turn-helix domain-containing protein [Rhizobiaceae bacterium n13]|uniref:Helix-turn-helix domain-containing protein n=1 Tax=Ferirhizobium litorale TaxID=2927786 RepID=A0AAE3QBB9_9HYPH|nr:helix-turn-helix domain-containing protein [Fererhizobium litorale]MDI7860695.1 helix-turn-helix domain-containing protein [Fererhizobium litorale]MDI7920843.1 helix-turn-helix domain-containing protein [Fererhizobium litorale]